MALQSMMEYPDSVCISNILRELITDFAFLDVFNKKVVVLLFYLQEFDFDDTKMRTFAG
jgi:hypothetical protein